VRNAKAKRRSGNCGAAGVRAGLLTTHLRLPGILRAAWSIILFYFILFYFRFPCVSVFSVLWSPFAPSLVRKEEEGPRAGMVRVSRFNDVSHFLHDTSRSRDLRALRLDYGKRSRHGSSRKIRANSSETAEQRRTSSNPHPLSPFSLTRRSH